MSYISKVELKKQLQELGIKVKGNYIRMSKHDVKADDAQKSIYYKADRVTDWKQKKPTIHEKKASKKPEGWFETKEEALSKYLEVQGIAKKRAIEIEKELDSLKKRLGFDIGYTDYLYLIIKVDDYEFIHKIEQD